MTEWQRFDRFEVAGRPATFATAAEAVWKEAVKLAVSRNPFPNPDSVGFKVILEFRTTSKRPDERWDIDNLAKPTLDAMSGIFGARKWHGPRQPQDDRIDELIARKRSCAPGELTGASIEVWFREEIS